MIQNGVITNLDYALTPDGTTGDLQKIFEEQFHDLDIPAYMNKGWYFTQASINPLSKRKPFAHSYLEFKTQSARDNALKSTRYGFGDIPLLGSNLNNTWTYHKPLGIAQNEPWRLLDFNGYYHNSPCPFKMECMIDKGGQSSMIGTGSLSILLSFDNVVPGWNSNYSMSFKDFIGEDTEYWNDYYICLLVRNLTRGVSPNFIHTNVTCAQAFNGYQSYLIFYHDYIGMTDPVLQIISDSKCGDDIQVIMCLRYGPPSNTNYDIYTDSTQVPWTIAYSSKSLGFIPGCDRCTTKLVPKYKVTGATGSAIFTATPTNTIVDTIGGMHGRLFTFNVGGTIDTTQCADWTPGSSIDEHHQFTGLLTVKAVVRIYVTSGAGYFFICTGGDPTVSEYTSSGYDDVGEYFEYERSIALKWGMINNRDILYHLDSAYDNTNDAIYIFAVNGHEDEAVSNVHARVWLRQDGIEDVSLTPSPSKELCYSKEYVVVDPVINYSSGDKIKADGSNYAYVTGTVQTYVSGSLIGEQQNVELTIKPFSNAKFYLDDNKVYGYDLGSTETQEYSYPLIVSYEYSPEVSAGYLKQEANTIVSTTGSTYVTAAPDKTTNIDAAGETIPSYCYVQRSLIYTWTSGHTTAGNDHSGTVNVYLDNELLGQTSHEQWFNVVIGSNKTDASASRVLKYAYSTDESVKSEITLTQNAGYITYAKPIIPDGAWYCSDIPAWGGTSRFYGSGYQTWGWNGSETGGGTDYIDITWSSPTLTAESLGTTVTSQKTLVGTSQGTITAHGKTSDPVTGYCYQSINSKSQDGDDTLNEKVYGTPTTIHTDARNPYLTMTAQNYTDENNPCPAVGSSTLLDIVCTEEQKYQKRYPWTRTKTRHYKYTSGATSTEDYAYDSGTEDRYTDWTVIDMNPTITGEAEGFMRFDKVVACLDRYKTTGPLRYVDYTATFRNLSVTVRIYQQANYVSTTTRQIRTASIYEYQGERIPASGASLTVNYECYDMVSRVYTSGAVEEEHYESANDYLWGVNCSIDQSPIEVHDTGQQSVLVSSNTSSTTRTIIVGIKDSSDIRIQNGRT